MRFFRGLLMYAGAVMIASSTSFGAALIESVDEAAIPSVQEHPNSEFIVARWTSADGLPANEIQDIAETPDGYLWLGTFQGLVRFDGVRFSRFFSTPSGLRYGARVGPMAVGGNGLLWLAPDEIGLIYGDAGRFTEVLTNAEGLTARIENLCADPTNGVWWVDANGKLGHISSDQKVEVLKDHFNPASRWLRGADGKMWLVGPRRARWYADGKWQVVAIPGASAMTAAPARSGGLWIARDARLRLVTPEEGAREMGIFPWRGISRVACMAEDARNRLWIGTVGQGLYCFENGQFKQVIDTPSAVICIFADSSGSVWAGTRGGGLFRVRERQFFQHGLAAGLQNEYVRSLAQDSAGRMWLATAEGGLGWLKAGVWNPLSQADGWTKHDSLAVYPSKDGSVIIATAKNGLWRWQDGKPSRIPLGAKGPKEPVADLLEDHRGRIWMVTDNSGVFCRDGTNVIRYTPARGLPSSLIRCLVEDDKGDLWVADWEGGVARFNEDHWQVVRQPSAHSDAVRAMIVSDGTVWLGTSAGGLLRWKNGVTTRLTTEQGLPDNSVRQLLFDGDGSLWATTPHKLFRLNMKQVNDVLDGREHRVEAVTYGRSEGLPEVSFASWCDPRCWRTPEGELWLATANGAIRFQPAALPEREVPKVIIEETMLNGKVIPASELRELRPGSHVLKFTFTAPCLTAPERVRFRYRLSGVNSEWVETSADRTATFASLPAGKHEFRVIASSPDGVWGTEAATVAVAVRSYFWQTKWFLAVAVACIAGGGAWLLRRATIRRLRRRLDELHRQQAIERERARIARDIHDELGASLTSIGLLADIGQRHRLDPKAVASDFDQISKTARDSAVAIDAIVWAVNPRNDSVDHFANYIAQYAREFFGPTTIRTRLDLPPDLPNLPLVAETRHELFLVIKEAFTNIVRHAEATEVQLRLACEAGNLRLSITDNGKGLAATNGRPGSHGIGNMQERIERLGGKMKLNSAPGRGVQLDFDLPLPKPALN